MTTSSLKWITSTLMTLVLLACTNASTTGGPEVTEKTATTQAALDVVASPRSISFEFSDVSFLPAGIAAGSQVFFIGDPLDGRVFAYSRFTSKQIGELPQPPGGFVVPFIMHELGEGRVGILAAGGLPQLKPFVPAQPVIYEYTYTSDPISGFSASLARLVSFADELIGFPEDFVRLADGRELLTDSVLGSIWVVETDGTV